MSDRIISIADALKPFNGGKPVKRAEVFKFEGRSSGWKRISRLKLINHVEWEGIEKAILEFNDDGESLLRDQSYLTIGETWNKGEIRQYLISFRPCRESREAVYEAAVPEFKLRLTIENRGNGNKKGVTASYVSRLCSISEGIVQRDFARIRKEILAPASQDIDGKFKVAIESIGHRVSQSISHREFMMSLIDEMNRKALTKKPEVGDPLWERIVEGNNKFWAADDMPYQSVQIARKALQLFLSLAHVTDDPSELKQLISSFQTAGDFLKEIKRNKYKPDAK